VPSVPGDHTYDVVYRATADFTDLFAEVAAAKAAMEELKESTDDTNSSSEDGAKAAADAEEARTKAMQDASKAAKEYEQQQLLLNKAENNGFNTPQEAKAFRDQDTQSLLQHNIQENGGRTSPDQALQDIRNKTAALNSENASLAEMRETIDESTNSLQDASKAAQDFQDSLEDLEEGSQDVKQAVEDTGQALDDFSSKSKSAGSNASQTGNNLKDIAEGASIAARGIDDVNQSLDESSKAFLEYQQARKDANSAANQTPTTSLNTSIGNASTDIEEAMREQAAAIAAANQSRNNMSAESLAESAEKNAANNVSTGLFSAEALNGAKNFAEEVEEEVTPAVKNADSALKAAGQSASGLSDEFEASTAQGVVLSAAMADVDKKVEGLSNNLSSGFSSAFVKQLGGVLKDYNSVAKAATGLDDPSARQWVVDTGNELDSLAVQLQETQKGIEGVGGAFESSGDDADNFGTVLSKVNSASAVILASNLESIENKLAKMHSDLETGGNDWDTFASSIAKTNSQLNAATKQAAALDDPAAKNAVTDLKIAFDSLSMQALASRDDVDVFTASEMKNSAASVILASNIEAIEDKLTKMSTDLEAGGNDWDAFSVSIAKTNAQLNAASKQADALDDPDAKNAVNDLKEAFGYLSQQALASKDDLDVFTAAESKNSATSVLLSSNIDSVRSKVDDLENSLKSGDSAWNDFIVALTKANTELAGVGKQAGTLGDTESRNSINALQLALNDIAVQALGSKDDLGAFKTAEDVAAESAAKLAAATKDAKTAAYEATTTYKIFASGLKAISNEFASLSAQTKAEGGGSGFLGFLGNFLGGGLSGVSSGFNALATAAGSALPLVLGLSVAIPAVATAIVGLATIVGGLVGAMAPMVGIFITFLPIILGVAEAAGVLYLAIEPLISAVNEFRQATTKSGAEAALKGLSPVMAQAAKDIAGFIKALTGAKGALKDIGTEVFSPLLGSLSKLSTVIKPVEEALNTMAGAAGKFLQPVLAGFVNFLDSSNFQTLTKAAADGLVYFGGTVSNFLDALGKLATDAAPYTVQIAKIFDDLSKALNTSVSVGSSDGSISTFLNQMMTGFGILFNIISGIFDILAKWGPALAPIGNLIGNDLAKGLHDAANAADSVDFKQWNSELTQFISGIGTAAKGIGTLFAALVNNKFLGFLGDILTDIGHIATALAPIVKFFTDIVAGSLPALQKIFNDISGVVVGILKPIDDFLDKVEQNKDAMKVLSGIFTALASLVIAGSVLSFFSMLGGLAGKGFSGLIDLINKIPGINLPGGSGGSSGSSTPVVSAINKLGVDVSANADENAAKIVTAITGEETEEGVAGEGESAAGAEAAGIGATATIAGIVTAVLAFLGAGFLIYEIIHGAADPNSTVHRANSYVTQHDGANWWDREVAGPADRDVYDPTGRGIAGAAKGLADINKTAVPDFFTDDTQWEKDANKAMIAFFTGNAGWEKASNTAIPDFFTDKSEWERTAQRAVGDFFTNNDEWEKASETAVGHFFTDNTAWEKAANHAIADFFTDNTGWEKAADKSISGWFSSAGEWFMRDVYEPIEKWVTNDFVGFFTNSVARWFTDAGSWFMRDVYEPVKNWVTGDFVNFFTSSIPHWFDDVTTWFMRDVYNPVEHWVMNDIPGFFTNSIPNWFSSVWKEFQKNVVDPIGNWLTGTGSDSLTGFFEAGFKDALNAVIKDVFNNGLIHLLNDALGVVGLKIPNIPTFAAGGHVQGNLGEADNSDSVWAKLTPGEFVIRKRAAAALGPDTLAQLNQADRPGAIGKHANGGYAGAFAGGGIVGDVEGWGSSLLSGAEGLVGDVASWASSFVSGALQSTFNEAYKAIVNPILGTLPSGTIPTGMATLAAGSVKNAVDVFLGAQDQKADAAATGAVGGSLPTGDHKQIIVEALQAAGVAANQWPVWETGLNTLITRESSWNPSSVNTTDSNAAAGNPSEGLAQTTGTTFNEYHVPGTSDDILDPVANVAAAIKYIEDVYGSITNVQQANANEPPKGYATGGFVGDPTLGMGFAAGGYSMAPTAGTPSMKSQAGMNAGGRLSGPGVHVENLNITNPIPEQSGDSLQRAMTRLRVYDGRGN